MAHSFSFGIDARIGLGFERNRTSYRCCNQVVYAWEGIKRLLCCCCRPATKIKEILSRFSVHPAPLDCEGLEEELKDDEEKILFAANKNETVGDEYLLRGEPQSIVCTNIE